MLIKLLIINSCIYVLMKLRSARMHIGTSIILKLYRAGKFLFIIYYNSLLNEENIANMRCKYAYMGVEMLGF